MKEEKYYIESLKSLEMQDAMLANATCGMKSYSQLDQRCIVLSAHLTYCGDYSEVCKSVYTECEKYCAELRIKYASPSHCGLVAFLDHDGSKFSGANRDVTCPHFHALLFYPHLLTPEQVEHLISRIKSVFRNASRNAELVPDCVASSKVAKFDRFRVRSHADGTIPLLADAILYAAKDALSHGSDFGVYYPFDLRAGMPGEVVKRLLKRRKEIIAVQKKGYRWKLYRAPLLHVFEEIKI